MIRTKDGGAVLDNDEYDSKDKGKKRKIKLTKEEFIRNRAIRDLIRIGICFGAGAINYAVNYYIYEDWSITIAVILIMIGWRLKAGW